jgi:UDP-sulfoquinovose synthase
LNIRDTLRCVELAADNPPTAGEYRVFNQFTEQFSVCELAEVVAKAATEIGLSVEIESIKDPRVEREEHYYNPKHTRLLDLGLEPHLLSEELIERMLHIIQRYQDRISPESIDPTILWRPPAHARLTS